MQRRGEGQFVANEVGFWNNPKVRGLARKLGVPAGLAGSYVKRWEEFILSNGDVINGRVRGYTIDEIAEAVEFRGRAPRLLGAMQDAGFIRVQRGSLMHPFWTETVTGQYARRKAEERQRWHERRLKEAEQSGGSAEAPRSGTGGSVEAPRALHGETDIKKERDSAEAPPDPPAEGGGTAAARWQWLRENHPRPLNSRECERLLGQMSEERWQQVVGCLTQYAKEGRPISMSRKFGLRWGSDRWLRLEAFLGWKPKKLRETNGQNGHVDEAVVKLRQAVTYALAEASDTELPEKRRRRAREALEQLRGEWAATMPAEPFPGAAP